MDKFFYITFNWNKEVFYDGYFIKRSNGKITGYAHEAFLVGDSKTGLIQINESNQIMLYEQFDAEKPIYIVKASDNSNIIIKITEVKGDIQTKTKIMKRTQEILFKIPKETKEAIKKYL